MPYHVSYIWHQNKTNKQKQAHRYKEKTGGWQSQRVGGERYGWRRSKGKKKKKKKNFTCMNFFKKKKKPRIYKLRMCVCTCAFLHPFKDCYLFFRDRGREAGVGGGTKGEGEADSQLSRDLPSPTKGQVHSQDLETLLHLILGFWPCNTSSGELHPPGCSRKCQALNVAKCAHHSE